MVEERDLWGGGSSKKTKIDLLVFCSNFLGGLDPNWEPPRPFPGGVSSSVSGTCDATPAASLLLSSIASVAGTCDANSFPCSSHEAFVLGTCDATSAASLLLASTLLFLMRGHVMQHQLFH